jgi:hypothetical protein
MVYAGVDVCLFNLAGNSKAFTQRQNNFTNRNINSSSKSCAWELLSSFGIVLDYIIVRNFAFTGLPFFIFGYLLRKYSHLFEKIRPLFLILAIVISSCEAVLSRFLVGHNEVFIGSVLCCLSVVLLSEKIKNKEIPSKYLPVFRSSTDVYVFHILFSGFLYSLANILPLTVGTVMRMFMPCLTFAICIAFSLIKFKIIRSIKKVTC